MSVTLGADPEAFIYDHNNERPVQACGLLGGKKGAPIDIGRGIGLQEDNVMVEWNQPVTTDPEAFANMNDRCVQTVREFVRTKTGFDLDLKPQMKFPTKELTSEQAVEFGCSADYNAYLKGAPFEAVSPAALEHGKNSDRFAGGHIHIGYNNPHDVPEYVIASLCDLFIGADLARWREKQHGRRELYGQPGRYRPTTYGIEYRTPGNMWCTNWDMAYTAAHGALTVGRLMENADRADIQALFRLTPWNDVRRAIINEDRTLASNVVQWRGREFGSIIRDAMRGQS